MSILRSKYVVAMLLLSLPLSLVAQRKKKTGPAAGVQTATPGPDYKSVGSPLPPIRGVIPGKAVFTNKELQNGSNLFVMIFNPTCEHCEEMAQQLKLNISLFQKSNIILLAAPHMGPYLEYFENNTRISEAKIVKVALDSADFLQKAFRYEALPQMNVYSPQGTLLKSFSGITTIDSLKPFIQ